MTFLPGIPYIQYSMFINSLNLRRNSIFIPLSLGPKLRPSYMHFPSITVCLERNLKKSRDSFNFVSVKCTQKSKQSNTTKKTQIQIPLSLSFFLSKQGGKVENWIRHDSEFRILFQFHCLVSNPKDPNERFSIYVHNLHESNCFIGFLKFGIYFLFLKTEKPISLNARKPWNLLLLHTQTMKPEIYKT